MEGWISEQRDGGVNRGRDGRVDGWLEHYNNSYSF